MSTTFAPTIRMHHATRAKAEKLAATIAAEYPRLSIEAIQGDAIDHETYECDCAGFRVLFAADSDEEQGIYEGDKIPSLALILDTCAEEGIDPAAEEDEDEKPRGGSVVPEEYRRLYREASSTGRSNGDWLAEQLAGDTLNGEGKLVLDDFIAILEKNGVDMSGKWAAMRFSQTPGWQGRFRMNGRQVLEKMVAKTGEYIDHTDTVCVPNAEWLADMRSKHAKWLAKEAKREAAAEKAIREMVEGA